MPAFIQARNYTRVEGRDVDLVICHTMEYPERPESAEWCASYFAGPKAPRASAHYMVDADSVIQGVRDKDVAWAAPGANHNGIQIEHAGYAAQGAKGWGDDYSKRMVVRSARLAARLCRKHGIPARWLSVADLKAGRRGITSHANVSLAFKRSSHTDPGPDFPVAGYLKVVRAEIVRLRPKPRPKVKPASSATNPSFRVDIDSGPVKLRDQSLENPKVRARLGRLVKRFGRAVVRRRLR